MIVDTATRREGPRSKRSAIISVAIDQFGRTGYEHTKWASIADEVGIGQTALYHYFESKAHCLLTIMRLELADSVERFDAAVTDADEPVAALRAAVAAALTASPADALQRRILHNHMDLLAAPRQSGREEAERLRSRELVQEVETRWAALLARGAATGAFACDDPHLLSRLLLGMTISVWRWYRPDGPLGLDGIIDAVSDSAVRLVRP